MRWIVALVMLTACKGPAGDAGPQGEQGLQGEPGPPGDPAAYWWVDAQGQRVAPYGSDVYVDEAGLVWQFYPEREEFLGSRRITEVSYTTSDCTDVGYVADLLPLPREVVEIDGELFARQDDAMPTRVLLTHWDSGGSCGPRETQAEIPAIPLSAFDAVGGLPAPGWMPPLRVEN
jgi:hypothetical protein